MCKGSLVCQCHVETGMLQQLGQMQGMDQALLGNYPQLAPYKNQYLAQDFDSFIRNYYIIDSDKKLKLLSEPKMKITGKEYLVVSGITIVESTPDLDAAKKRAGELAHSTQGTVYIFQPVLEIAPKRDVVETTISLAK